MLISRIRVTFLFVVKAALGVVVVVVEIVVDVKIELIIAKTTITFIINDNKLVLLSSKNEKMKRLSFFISFYSSLLKKMLFRLEAS